MNRKFNKKKKKRKKMTLQPVKKHSDRGMQDKTTMTHCFSTIALVEIKKQDNILLLRLGKR